MGKNISVYLNDELLNLVENSGKPVSQVIQAALKNYFHSENKSAAYQKVVETARLIGNSYNFEEAVDELEHDRENDRW